MAPYEPFNSQQQQQYPQMNGQNNNNIICQPTHNQNNNNSQSTSASTTAAGGGTTKVALCASCDRCRTRKTKCDGERPCSNCASRYKKVMKVDRYVFYFIYIFLQIISMYIVGGDIIICVYILFLMGSSLICWGI